MDDDHGDDGRTAADDPRFTEETRGLAGLMPGRLWATHKGHAVFAAGAD